MFPAESKGKPRRVWLSSVPPKGNPAAVFERWRRASGPSCERGTQRSRRGKRKPAFLRLNAVAPRFMVCRRVVRQWREPLLFHILCGPHAARLRPPYDPRELTGLRCCCNEAGWSGCCAQRAASPGLTEQELPKSSHRNTAGEIEAHQLGVSQKAREMKAPRFDPEQRERLGVAGRLVVRRYL